MKKLLIVLLSSLFSYSYASESGFYLGAGVSSAFTNGGSDINTQGQFGFGLQGYVGYNFMRYLGTEFDINGAGYFGLGSFIAAPAMGVLGEYKLSALSTTDYGLAAIAYLPLFPTSNFKFFAKAGLSLNTQELSYSGQNTYTAQEFSGSATGTNLGLLLGAGMQYDVLNTVIVRLAYQNNGVSNFNNGFGSTYPNYISLSLGYKF